jgi:hypothetical protein
MFGHDYWLGSVDLGQRPADHIKPTGNGTRSGVRQVTDLEDNGVARDGNVASIKPNASYGQNVGKYRDHVYIKQNIQ